MLTVKPISKNEVLNSQYIKDYNDNLYAVIDGKGHTIAYVSFSIDNDVMRLDMIEVVAKKKGLGRKIINFMFENYSLSQIEGLVLCEVRALNFWNKLGAEIYYIDVEGYGIEELEETGLESPFFLNR